MGWAGGARGGGGGGGACWWAGAVGPCLGLRFLPGDWLRATAMHKGHPPYPTPPHTHTQTLNTENTHACTPPPDVGLDKWLCITLLVAAECALKLPKIRTLADLKKCLAMLGGLRSDDVVAVELLWTPQEEGDAYSKEEMLQDYPALANL